MRIVETISEQMTTRDAALLTWLGVLALSAAWSITRGGDWGRSVVDVLRTLLAPRVLGLIAAVVAWQVLIVYLASKLDLWDPRLVKDTVFIVIVGGVLAGFRAIALMKGEKTWRQEFRSVLTLVVAVQWVSNLETLPYLIELAIIPLAVLLGGVQAVAQHSEEHRAILPVINGSLMVLGLTILGWSIYQVAGAIGSTAWDEKGRSFLLAFWLPLALLPAVYFAAVGMQYGKTLTIMKLVRPPSLGARLDFFLHHRFSLRRLSAFAQKPARVREYARAQGKIERRAILRQPAD